VVKCRRWGGDSQKGRKVVGRGEGTRMGGRIQRAGANLIKVLRPNRGIKKEREMETGGS
jgi:hypothetical protein